MSQLNEQDLHQLAAAQITGMAAGVGCKQWTCVQVSIDLPTDTISGTWHLFNSEGEQIGFIQGSLKGNLRKGKPHVSCVNFDIEVDR